MTDGGNAPMRAAKWLKWRLWVQFGFLFVWLDPLALRIHNFCGPVFHCYACPLATFACPIGVIANFSGLTVLPFIAIGTLLAVAAFVGSFICGWVCPFGYLQDLLAKIPVRRWRLPGWAGYTRYAVLLVLVLVIPFFYGESHPLFICRVCPAGGLEAAVPSMVKQAVAGEAVAWPSWPKIMVVALFVVGVCFTWRPWCTLLCPLGAIYGLTNRASALRLKFDAAKCTHCGACKKMCRYGVDPTKRANDTRCIRCLDCTKCAAISVTTILKRESRPS